MSHIIIDKAQADTIRGRHGIYSAVEPVPTPDGKYIVPEAYLSDKDLAEIKTTLESYVTPTNVQEITDLPDIGQQCLIVWYPTLNSTLYRSKIDNNSWSPDEYANGWEIYVP